MHLSNVSLPLIVYNNPGQRVMYPDTSNDCSPSPFVITLQLAQP